MAVLKTVLLVLLSLATLYYFVRSFIKFKEHKISESTQREAAGLTIGFPSITICSGFRDGNMTPVLIAEKKQNSTQDSVDILGNDKVRELSYSRTEYLTYFTQALDNYWYNNMLYDDDLWTEEFHEHFGGRCATFNPKNETKPGQLNSIMFGLQWPRRDNIMNCDMYRKEDCFYQFPIFFHPKGAFIYNKGQRFIGQTFIYPTTNSIVYYTIEKKRKRLLNKKFEPCDADITLADWKNCYLNAYDKRAGCIYPWMVKNPEDRAKACNMSQTNARLKSIEHHTWWDIDTIVSTETGCLKPCNFDQYQLTRLPYENSNIPYGWIFNESTQAVFRIFYVDTVVETTEEYLAYDMFSLFGELGGAVGLFLGWSIMQMVEGCILLLSKHMFPSK